MKPEKTMNPKLINFRRMGLEDLPQLHRWMNTPHVQRWWGGREVSLKEVEAKYGLRIRGEAPTTCYFVLYGNVPIGYIQTYRIRDYPDYARDVLVEDGAAGLDVFIGEPKYVGRGLGTEILRRSLGDVVFGKTDAESCIVGPEPANQVAIRAYEKAGFRYLKTVEVTEEDQPEYLMRVTRDDFLRAKGG